MNRSPVKYPGSKRLILDKVLRRIGSGGHLVDVFAGSCVVGLNAEFDTVHFNDINADLINIYQNLKSDKERYIAELEEMFVKANNQSSAYYQYREEFNHITDARRRSVLLFYLSRHSFNSLVRFNRSGAFNAPMGRYAKPYFPEDELRYFVSQCHRFTFSAMDYTEVFIHSLTNRKSKQKWYVDPPYEKLDKTSDFSDYQPGGFNRADHVRLAELCKRAASLGDRVVVSNHSTPFTRELYKEAKQYRFSVPRTISSKTSKRVPAKELLATY